MKPMKTTKEISVNFSGKFFEIVKWTFPFVYLLWFLDVSPVVIQFPLIVILVLYEAYYWFLLCTLTIFTISFVYMYWFHFKKFKEHMMKLKWETISVKERFVTVLYIGFIIFLASIPDWSLFICLLILYTISISAHILIPFFHLLYKIEDEVKDEVDIGELQ